MVNNTGPNRQAMTDQYKMQYGLLNSNLVRLQADLVYYQQLAKSRDAIDRKEAANGIKATTIQMPRQKKFTSDLLSKAKEAYGRGEIYKFW